MKLIHLNLEQKQRLRVVGVIAGILAIALVLTLVLQGNKGRKNGAPPKEKMVLLKDRVGKDTWAPADSSKIALLETEVQRLKADLEATQKAQKEQEAKELASKFSKPADNILKVPLPSPSVGRDAPPIPPVPRYNSFGPMCASLLWHRSQLEGVCAIVGI